MNQPMTFIHPPLANSAFLVTGGAGFIGSHLVDYLLANGAGLVRVLDNGSTGFYENLDSARAYPNFEFIDGDITNQADCERACAGISHVSHQAALGSVPRSIATPITSHTANVTGFLTMLVAANQAGVRRFVYASSSSVYGDSPRLPKVEEQVGQVLSPYAATKVANELYAGVFGRVYGLETVGLRYFNVFGPRQSPTGPYAAVIPRMVEAVRTKTRPLIHGNGKQTRDFTYVDNAVQANVLALLTNNPAALNQVYNVAVGEQVSINQVWEKLQQLASSAQAPMYGPARPGDVRDSLASIDKANTLLGYRPTISFDDGLTALYHSLVSASSQ